MKKLICISAPNTRLKTASRTDDANRGFNIIEIIKQQSKYKKVIIKNYEIKS